MNLEGRKTDEWGNVIFSMDGLLEQLMRGGSLSSLVTEKTAEIDQFNRLCREFDHPEDQIQGYQEPTLTVEESDLANQQHWFTPEPYASMDVKVYLIERCQTAEQVARVEMEWDMFMERGMNDVLRFLVYMIANLRERGIVWGVGRGSSVASYCLYLIGVHRIDSMRFNLDPREFLK